MIAEYIQAALRKAHYEMIEEEEPFYGEIHELKGVWATGKTLEECRENLAENLEGWLLIRNSQGLEIPEIDGYRVTVPKVMQVA